MIFGSNGLEDNFFSVNQSFIEANGEILQRTYPKPMNSKVAYYEAITM